MSFNLLTVVQDTEGLSYSSSVTSEAPPPTFSGVCFWGRSWRHCFTPSHTDLLGLTISFAVIGSQQLHAEQPLKTADPIQNTCGLQHLIILPCLCQIAIFKAHSIAPLFSLPLMWPESDIPFEGLHVTPNFHASPYSLVNWTIPF